MSDNLFILDELSKNFTSVAPRDFYRDIFPLGDLSKEGECVSGKYKGIAVELVPLSKEDKEKNSNKEENNKKSKDKKGVRCFICDDLNEIDVLLQTDNFVIVSPISYAGRHRKRESARFIYALTVDLDGITKKEYIIDLIHQFKTKYLPNPTYIVFSGTGIHLYYQFENPIPCFKNIIEQLSKLKYDLINRIWNEYTTSLSNNIQYGSIFQGFRLAGGVTKSGGRTKVFHTGNKITLEYLNRFVINKENQFKYSNYKSKYSLLEAKDKFPKWYNNKIINKRPNNTWIASKNVYDWWLRRIKNEIKEGHRYYSIMILAIYAKKCGVSKDILDRDAYKLLDKMESLTTNDNNHFTKGDITSALKMYNDSYITFPIDTISKLSGLSIIKNKRNYRKQYIHLKIARNNKLILKEEGLMKKEGRPSKEFTVHEWRKFNPDGSKSRCIRETGLSKMTVYKYWDI